MRKNSFLKIVVVGLLTVLLFSLAACGGLGKKSGGNSGSSTTVDSGDDGVQSKTGDLKASDIKKLANLADYSKSASDYNPAAKTFSGTTYDGKDCSAQITKLQNRIDKKTEDVWLGKTESAVTKIFTKSTPEGILGAIAQAALTFDEMVRTVDYIAGEEDADVNEYMKETSSSWTGKLIVTSTTNESQLWLNVKNSKGKELNDGWSLFDDWELYDRLKEYAKSSKANLTGSDDNKLNDIGTKEIAEDNASWQYRSILEKIYKPASEGGVDLPGATAARLATRMLEYAQTVSEGMAGGTLADAYSASNVSGNGNKNTAAFSSYFRNKVPTPATEYESVSIAQASWDPYAGLGDYDVLTYFLSFYEYRNVNGQGYGGKDGLQSCALLYGYYYQYNQTYYNVVLKNKETYKKQLRYEKLDTFSDTEWLDYVLIQRTNYEQSYRYTDAFYREFYLVHFNFQGKKERYEKVVYIIGDVINNVTYTGEMLKALNNTSEKAVEGQLAMSDWMWCYGASTEGMKTYNQANTDYQTGRVSGNNEAKFRGQFYYELEELKIVAYLLNKMTPTELSGALFYNCYGYSGSLISQIQGYEKDMVLVGDAIKTYDKFTKIPTNINAEDYNEYAIDKMDVLQAQAEQDWRDARVEDSAAAAKSQPWTLMAAEVKAAQDHDYDDVKGTSSKNVWEVRCEVLEDRVIARNYSCCGQRVSEVDLSKCGPYHGVTNSDMVTAVTKDYDINCNISKFVSDYEPILYYVATKAKVSFQKPSVGYKTGDTSATYTVGYYGNIQSLISNASTGSDGRKMTYKELKAFTVGMGSTFQEDIASKDDDDGQWWATNKVASDKNKFGPTKEKLTGSSTEYTYTYTFKGWYLDQACQFEFLTDDDIDFGIVVYAGYDLTIAR